jgi:hypothetical protein
MIVVDGVGFQIGRWRVLRLGRSRDREAEEQWSLIPILLATHSDRRGSKVAIARETKNRGRVLHRFQDFITILFTPYTTLNARLLAARRRRWKRGTQLRLLEERHISKAEPTGT